MKLFVCVLSLSLLILLGHEAVQLHKLTVCRQEAWRSSLILHTRTLLTRHPVTETELHPTCGIMVNRQQKNVSWRRLTAPRKHRVSLNLEGKL